MRLLEPRSLRHLLVGCVAIVAGLPSAASATTWDVPIALQPSKTATAPAAVAADAVGDAIAVTAASGTYGDPYVVRLDSIARRRVGVPAFLPGAQVVDTAPDRDGLLVLIFTATNPKTGAGRLTLLHARFGDARPSVRARWSVTAPAEASAAVAATGRGSTVVWVGLDGRAMEANIDRAWRSGPARALAVPRADPPRGVSTTMDLESDGRGGSILALVSTHRQEARLSGSLAIADAAAGRRFTLRQRVGGITGAPQLVRGGAGRTGLLVVDAQATAGDCEALGFSRRLWASVRARGAHAFAAPRLLLTSHQVCYVPWQQLTAGRDGRFAVAWGLGDFLDSSGSVAWLSTAAPGGMFGRPAVIARNLTFLGAGYDSGETLSVVGSRGDRDTPSPPQTVVQRRPAAGSPGPFTPLPPGSSTEHETSGLAAHPAVFVSTAGGLGVQLSHNP